MENTYLAVEITAPGVFNLTRRAIAEPAKDEVRLRVEACGVCHSDAATYANAIPGITFPRVPGHEVIGRIDSIGANVTSWKMGQRVGVGFLAGPCLHCTRCRKGDFVSCSSQVYTGVHSDGGYAEMMIARETALVSIPDALSASDAAPLLCAGVTTFNALRNSGARPGELVAVQGIGGLGHLAVRFAKGMGFRVAAIARGESKRAQGNRLGADIFIDSTTENAAETLQGLGGAVAIIATAAANDGMGALLAGLTPRGKLIVVGVGLDGSINISATDLIFGIKSLQGSLTGSTSDCEDTLTFSVAQAITPTIETMKLEDAPRAFEKMMAGKANLRIVLTMARSDNQQPGGNLGAGNCSR